MRREKGGFWVGLAAALFYPLAFLVGRARYIGREFVPPTGGALIVANHISYLDPLYTSLFVHRARRVPRFLAKASLWKIPVFGAVLSGAEQVPVYRESADAQRSLSAALDGLRAGKIVVIYPEGTITRDPRGWPMQSRTGVARLALQTLDDGIPVIPLVHWGTQEIYDHYNRSFRPLPRKTVTVRAAAPVDLSEYRGRSIDGPLLREVTDRLMAACRDLLAEVRGEPAPADFFRYVRPARGGSAA